MQQLKSSTKDVKQFLSLAVSLFLLTALAACSPNADQDAKSNDTLDSDVQAATGGGVGAFINPRAIAEEPDGNLIVADFNSGHIIRVNRLSGDRQILSDNGDTSAGPSFSQAAGVAILPNGQIFVTDLALNNVFEIDAASGKRTLFSGGDATAIRQPFGLSSGMVNGKMMLVVADTGSAEGGNVVGPVLVDAETGDVVSVPVPSDNIIQYNDPRSIAVVETPYAENGESYLLVGNFGEGTIVKVNPTSGKRTMVSKSGGDDSVGTGPAFVSITDISIVSGAKSVYVLDLAREAIIDVNIETGNRIPVTRSNGVNIGSGFDLLNPHGIATIKDGYMITDFGAPGVIFVDHTGKRTAFSVTPVKGFGQIRGIDKLSDGDFAVADFGGEGLYIVDHLTGERTLLSGRGRGDGPKLNGPVSVDELNADTLVISEFSSQSILFVDRKTGNRSYLTSTSEGGRGSGPALGTRGITIDPTDTSRILATDFATDAVFAVDIKSGNRSIYSGTLTDTPRGTGPALNNPFGIDVAHDGTVYDSDIGLQAVVAINQAGDRRILSSNEGKGTGIKFGSPWGIHIVNGKLYVADAPGLIEVDLQTGDRTLASPGGPIFTLRELEGGKMAIANIGTVNGIEIEDAAGVRTILSNADNPK